MSSSFCQIFYLCLFLHLKHTVTDRPALRIWEVISAVPEIVSGVHYFSLLVVIILVIPGLELCFVWCLLVTEKLFARASSENWG